MLIFLLDITSGQGIYKQERERGLPEKLPVQLSTTSVHQGEDQHKVIQKMKFLTYVSLGLFGLLLCSPFPGAEADSCARDWLQNQGNCYAYFDIEMTWSEAETDCQSYGRGAHLASVLSKAEAALIAQYISTYQTEKNNVWIGLHDPRQNRRWRWSDESVYSYKAWAVGQPNYSGNIEYCAELLRRTNFREWNDTPCRKLNAYICKYEL